MKFLFVEKRFPPLQNKVSKKPLLAFCKFLSYDHDEQPPPPPPTTPAHFVIFSVFFCCLSQAVDFRKKCISYYDSLKGSNNQCLSALRWETVSVG